MKTIELHFTVPDWITPETLAKAIVDAGSSGENLLGDIDTIRLVGSYRVLFDSEAD